MVQTNNMKSEIIEILKHYPEGLSAEKISSKMSPSNGKKPDQIKKLSNFLAQGCQEQTDENGNIKAAWLISDSRDGKQIYKLLGISAIAS